MRLECTLVGGPAGKVSGSPLELTVEVEPGTPGSVIEEAIAVRFGTHGLTAQGRLLTALVVGQPPLVNRLVLVDDARLADLARQKLSSPPGGDSTLSIGLPHPEPSE